MSINYLFAYSGFSRVQLNHASWFAVSWWNDWGSIVKHYKKVLEKWRSVFCYRICSDVFIAYNVCRITNLVFFILYFILSMLHCTLLCNTKTVYFNGSRIQPYNKYCVYVFWLSHSVTIWKNNVFQI